MGLKFIERIKDPTIQKLEKNVFSAMNKVIGDKKEENIKDNIKNISFEEAIKELISMEKK
jgi:ATP phosphoribosyltransferase